MKNVLLAIAILLAMTAFKPFENSFKSKIETNALVEYGSWQKVSCYRGIQFRTVRGAREDDGSYWWSVQFRNLYNKKVRFDYNIVEPEKEEKIRREQIILDVWTLNANHDPEQEGYDSPHGGNYVRSADKVFVYITNVRFPTEDNYSPNPIECDN